VLSAVEGISVRHRPWTSGSCRLLSHPHRAFSIQFRGTGAVGKLFGPCMVLWFATLAVLGGLSIAQTPAVLASIDPRHALSFAWQHPSLAFFVLGAVFLAITVPRPCTPTWDILARTRSASPGLAWPFRR